MPPSSAETPWTRWSSPLILFLAPGFALYMPNALVVALAVNTLIWLLEYLRLRNLPRLTYSLPIVIGCLAIWAMMSTIWAIRPKAALEGGLSLLSLTFLLLSCLDLAERLPTPNRLLCVKAILAGTVLGCCGLTIDVMSGGALAGWLRGYDINEARQQELALRSLNRGVCYLALLVPLLMFMSRQSTGLMRWSLLSIAGISATLTMSWGKQAVSLGLLAGFIGAVVFYFRPKTCGRVLSAILIVFALLFPFAARVIPQPEIIHTHDWLPQSLQHRLVIWNFTAQNVFQHPLTGWGMNAAKAIPGGDQDVVVGKLPNDVQWRLLPLHPHNAALQWWLELGVIGVIVALAALVIAILKISRLQPMAAAFGGFVLTEVIVMSSLSFGAWQSWWLASIILACWIFKIVNPLDQA